MALGRSALTISPPPSPSLLEIIAAPALEAVGSVLIVVSPGIHVDQQLRAPDNIFALREDDGSAERRDVGFDVDLGPVSRGRPAVLRNDGDLFSRLKVGQRGSVRFRPVSSGREPGAARIGCRQFRRADRHIALHGNNIAGKYGRFGHVIDIKPVRQHVVRRVGIGFECRTKRNAVSRLLFIGLFRRQLLTRALRSVPKSGRPRHRPAQ